MPLIVLLYLNRNEDETLRDKLFLILKISVSWGFGYIGFWFMKWVIASIFTSENIIEDAINKILFRTGIDASYEKPGSTKLNVIFSFIYNLSAYTLNLKNISIFIILVCFAIFSFTLFRNKINFSLKKFIPIFLVSFYPTLWCLVAKNHTFVHRFMTCKSIIVMTFSLIVSIICGWFDKDNELNVAETKKEFSFDVNEQKSLSEDKIAVLLPCYNEHLTIEKTIKRYKEALPEAKIYVYDNNSTDGSDEIARKAGAIVRYEKKQGKGNVVKSMFRDIDADCYFMVDADDTYMADNAQKMCNMVLNDKVDMVIGDRLSSTYFTEEKRKSHTLGNRLVRFLVNFFYKSKVKDIMTGQRAFSKRFVKNFKIKSGGFEIETEMTIFACENNMKIVEVPVNYVDRQEGSYSKLNTYKDGLKVILTIFKMFIKNHAVTFFGYTSLVFLFLGGLTGILALLITRAKLVLGISCSVLLFIFVILNITGEIISLIFRKKTKEIL